MQHQINNSVFFGIIQNSIDENESTEIGSTALFSLLFCNINIIYVLDITPIYSAHD